jgi:hypothetical protein
MLRDSWNSLCKMPATAVMGPVRREKIIAREKICTPEPEK